ncbi:FAD NAD(P)-binding domain protein [Madurella fahalii]|uniref:FAD NAD(P)-binding domain protein n=1 Tax=Madurella fahalii TaxID=1157608 RepID=A0ABQ0GPP5_9PEZI
MGGKFQMTSQALGAEGNTSPISDPGHFRVVIVGGGVAGLTLANALEKADIDYVLLERRSDVAPQVGASIGIMPNGARILDQLGVWKRVKEESEPLRVFYSRDSNGTPLCEPSAINLLGYTRMGYMTSWGERQKLLQALYENLEDTSKVLVNKSVVDINHEPKGVTAICEDGSSFSGDILIGADGVFSKTRTKMWELAEADYPELVRQDKDCLISEYNCLFGIAKGITQLAPGDQDTSYNINRCNFTIAAEGSKVYYFTQERLPQTYRLGDIPRYTEEDTEAFVARNGDILVRPAPNRLTVADLWKHTVSCRLVAIEEAKFKLWHWGRIACAGDSIHKSTPNLGGGGNNAIESVATLANGIKHLSDACACAGRRPTQQEVERVFADYQRTRETRAAGTTDASGALARVQNMHGLASRLFVKFLLPHLADFVPELTGNAMIGAAKLDFLPLPVASLTGTQPFNPSQGDGMHESKIRRALVAMPLLALAFGALFVMDVSPSIAWAKNLRDSGVLQLQGSSVPIVRSFYGVQGFDEFVALVNTYFFPSVYGYDPVSRRQVISFLTDGTVLLTIWIFESVRRANILTPLQWPNLFSLLGQVVGIGFAAPLYCFLHYIFSPIESFSALDRRLTRLRWSRAALPSVVLAYLVPFYLLLTWPPSTIATNAETASSSSSSSASPTRQLILFVWQLYPVYLSLTLYLVSRLWKDTTAHDKIRATQRDLPTLRWSVGLACALSAAVWVWAWLPHGVRAVFVPAALPRSTPGLTEFTREFLRWDEVFGFGAHLVWMGYLFWDLAHAGMLREGWVTVMAVGVVSVLALGPGATLGLGWLFREHILATRRHKDALTLESVERLHGVMAKD